MSPRKQAILSLVMVAAVAAGWYLYRNPEVVGFGQDSGSGADNGSRQTAGNGGEAGQRGCGRDNRIPGLIGGGGAVNVVTAPVEADQGGSRVVALGTAKAARSVVLYPQVSGIVADIMFRAGQEVAADAPLLRL